CCLGHSPCSPLFPYTTLFRSLVGLPLAMGGGEHEMTRRARRFARQLQARFRLPVDLADERRSSASAESALREAGRGARKHKQDRSEEHTSELQSRSDLVCRLL